MEILKPLCRNAYFCKMFSAFNLVYTTKKDAVRTASFDLHIKVKKVGSFSLTTWQRFTA
jgi:hypothetical protein